MGVKAWLFDIPNLASVALSAQLGSSAYLESSVRALGNLTVAWVRIRDTHILTVDQETFISDDRWAKILVHIIFNCLNIQLFINSSNNYLSVEADFVKRKSLIIINLSARLVISFILVRQILQDFFSSKSPILIFKSNVRSVSKSLSSSRLR